MESMDRPIDHERTRWLENRRRDPVGIAAGPRTHEERRRGENAREDDDVRLARQADDETVAAARAAEAKHRAEEAWARAALLSTPENVKVTRLTADLLTPPAYRRFG